MERYDARGDPSGKAYGQGRVDSEISYKFCKQTSGLQQILDTAHNGFGNHLCMGDSTGRRVSIFLRLPIGLEGLGTLLVHYILTGSVQSFYE